MRGMAFGKWLVLLFALSHPIHAHANFQVNYRDWQAMSVQMRLAYVMGAFDLLVTFATNDDRQRVRNRSISDCFIRLRVTSAMLADSVNDTYRNNPEIWGAPPVVIMNYVFARVCQQDIERDMRAAGHATVTPAEMLENMKGFGR